MTIFLGIVMVLAAAAFVAAPLVGAETSLSFAGGGSRSHLERQKQEAYAAIKEAEFDYHMGKLSETDFAAVRSKYAAQAVEAIAALDAARKAQPAQLNARRSPRIAFCPACGQRVPPRANFCSACGESLKGAVA